MINYEGWGRPPGRPGGLEGRRAVRLAAQRDLTAPDDGDHDPTGENQ
jgi:hypothetical protein